MFKSVKFRAILIFAILLVAVIFLLPHAVEIKGAWKKYLPSQKVQLGLDLQGGMHVLLALDTDRLMEHTLNRKVDQLKDGMITGNIRFTALDRQGGTIRVTVKADQRSALENLLAKDIPDLKVAGSRTEGNDLLLDLSLPENRVAALQDNAVSQALETIRNRVDQFGVTEPVIVKQGENQILVELPGIKEPQRALELIGRTAQLEFKLVDEENAARAGIGEVPEGDELLMMKTRNRETGVTSTTPILLKKQTLLTGDMLSDASVKIDSGRNGMGGSETYVALEFNSEGARIFDRITAENVNKRIAIVLDNTVYSAPVVRERISGGKASITGGFTPEEAKDLSIVLRAGALPAPVKVIQNVTIGPTLGEDWIRKGFNAVIVAGVLVLIFMIVYYKGCGVVADIALILNLVYLLGVFVAFRATMTLPGIAGIALTIGMGVDSNVLIFERMREELRLGKTVRAAVDAGYHKAWAAIIDSHITTLITTCILFIFGTGPIKGFAVTLSIGVVINLFTAVVGSKTIFDWIIKRYKPRTLSI